ncbi:hypothetical protein HPP92_016960 [Vanilla planifolia]|uniref:Uncharacterized protein n=1 Tax=Vanilla planifolia TaxID=51239 RepID=A0A835QH31_VANPL|nr:hypothetical protein HPP92_016960 [Vanilla planifolia]
MSSFSVPSWPLGGGFAKGSIDLGGLEVRRVSSFAKVWSAGGGQPSCCRPHSRRLLPLGSVALATADTTFARALVVRSVSDEGGDVLAAPTDFTSSGRPPMEAATSGSPVAPSGYHAVGYVVTPSADKPSLESLRCVREDLTEQCEESKSELWSTTVPRPITVRSLVPSVRGPRAAGLPPGTFVVRTSSSGGPSVVRCLKNKGANLAAAMRTSPK